MIKDINQKFTMNIRNILIPKQNSASSKYARTESRGSNRYSSKVSSDDEKDEKEISVVYGKTLPSKA